MAKQKVSVGDMVSLPLSSVAWFFERNVREQTESDSKLDMAMKAPWDVSQGMVLVEPIDNASRREGKDYRALAVQRLQEEYNRVKEDTSADGAVNRLVFETWYVQNGKIVAPDYVADTCNRRSLALRKAQILKIKDVQEETKAGDVPNLAEVITTTVPVKICEYETDIDRLKASLGENMGKTEGFKPLSVRDCLREAPKLFAAGISDAKFKDRRGCFRSIFKSIGQKLWNLCHLAHMFPGLHLIARLLMDPKEALAVPFERMKLTPDLLSYVRRTGAPEKFNPGETRLEEPEFSKYLSDVVANSGQQPRALTRDKIQAISNQNPNALVQLAARGIADGTSDTFLNLSMLTAPAVNALIKVYEKSPGEFSALEKHILTESARILA